MDQFGNKTGGRKKGTPNRVNASIKVRIKDFILKNEDEMLEAFRDAKPNEKLNFWYKMLNLVCAKQTSSEDDGEWRPGEGIDPNWMAAYEEQQRDDEILELEYKRERNEKMREEKEKQIYMQKFLETADETVKILSSQEFIKKAEKECGKNQFWMNFEDVMVKTVVKVLENKDIYPPNEIKLATRSIKPKPENPATNPPATPIAPTTSKVPTASKESTESKAYTESKASNPSPESTTSKTTGNSAIPPTTPEYTTAYKLYNQEKREEQRMKNIMISTTNKYHPNQPKTS